jgi:hypothetical protein
VLQLVRPIWSIQLRRVERLAALVRSTRYFDVHREAVEVFRRRLACFVDSWSEPLRLNGSHQAVDSFAAQGCRAHTFAQPTPPGAAGHAGARGWICCRVALRDLLVSSTLK